MSYIHTYIIMILDDPCEVKLTPESVENIHKLGGSILVSDRGNPPHSEIAKALAIIYILHHI